MFWILVVGLLALDLIVACGGGEGPTQPPVSPPTQSGAELLEGHCSTCHTLDQVQRASKTQAEWETSVIRMIGLGAELTEYEAQLLIEHLAETYGP